MTNKKPIVNILNLTLQNIISNSHEVEKSGIYFLFKDTKLLYIGQTNIGLARIFQHRGKIIFNKYNFIKCQKEQLNIFEDYLIRTLKPSINYGGKYEK